MKKQNFVILATNRPGLQTFPVEFYIMLIKEWKKGETMNVAKAYAGILEEELVPAMGCTEPIAIAYAAAIAREVLEAFPEKILVECSGNVIKNVKSVSIPNTDGLCGIEAAAVAGAVAGDSKFKMEVISEVTSEQKEEIRR